jgi:LPXTG-motif cell wall-anchored protein
MKRTRVLTMGFSAVLVAAGAAVMPAAAWADGTTATCGPYPLQACPPPPPQFGGTGSSEPTPPTSSAIAFSDASGGSLPFTGADIEQMAAVGGTALVLGSVLVARKRRRARA